MVPSEPRDFTVKSQWKEQVVYTEGDRSVVFDCAWGVEPYRLFVPGPRTWRATMPGWLSDRRVEIIARLVEHSGHEVVEDPDGWQGVDAAPQASPSV